MSIIDTADADTARGNARFTAKIANESLDFHDFAFDDRKVTASQVAEKFGAFPPEDFVVLQWLDNHQLETLRPNETVDRSCLHDCPSHAFAARYGTELVKSDHSDDDGSSAGKRSTTIQSVSIAARFLDILARADGPLALGEVARQGRTGTSTAHRYMQSLVRERLVAQDPMTGRYDRSVSESGGSISELCVHTATSRARGSS